MLIKAKENQLKIVREITQRTISEVYPQYPFSPCILQMMEIQQCSISRMLQQYSAASSQNRKL